MSSQMQGFLVTQDSSVFTVTSTSLAHNPLWADFQTRFEVGLQLCQLCDKGFIFLPPSACSGLAISLGTPPSPSSLSLLSTSVFILWFPPSPGLASLVMEWSNNKTGWAELQSRLDIYKLGSLGQFPDSSASQLTHLSSKDHEACLAEEHLKFQWSSLCQWRGWSDIQKY